MSLPLLPSLRLTLASQFGKVVFGGLSVVLAAGLALLPGSPTATPNPMGQAQVFHHTEAQTEWATVAPSIPLVTPFDSTEQALELATVQPGKHP